MEVDGLLEELVDGTRNDVEVDGGPPLAVAALERAERGERGGEKRGIVEDDTSTVDVF